MRIKLSLIAIFFFVCSTAMAQQNWGGGVDEERIHFGFTFQHTSSLYKIQKKGDWRAPFNDPDTGFPLTDSLSALYSKSSPGYGIGFVVNGRISNHVDVRLTPTLNFNNRKIAYEYVQRNLATDPTAPVSMPFYAVDQKVQATLVEFPLGLKIKSDRRNNFRAYMLYGAKYSYDITSKKKTDDAGNAFLYKLLKNRKSYLSYEAAFGMDLYFEYFKMSPEIKLSYSMNNILDNSTPNPYNVPIEKLMLRNVTFSLFFE